MSILVLGADGYLGWPLVCKLATSVNERIIAVDDLSKRRRVAAAGYGSGVPILPFRERMECLRRATSRADIAWIEAAVTDCAHDLIREHRPTTIIHLAQIPSAPYSMMSFESARETLENNEISNLAVLFAMRDFSPNSHLVKMGSMGEYAPCGVPVGEGYVDAILDGEHANRKVPFPRESSDVYHITKINDTNFVSMACRVWNLAVTDVMQSIVYGIGKGFFGLDAQLATRFDCDPIFGSVVNRFVSQAVTGVPLTVHGTGSATTGLIHLRDTISALAQWIANPAARGQHRVINQANETHISIGRLAEMVQEAGRERGLNVQLSFEYDPRHEAEVTTSSGPARNDTLRNSGIHMVPLHAGLRMLMDNVSEHADSLPNAAVKPNVDWVTGGRVGDAPIERRKATRPVVFAHA
jgi:UDP-sulfoquinovose synthase